jgi:hypothetical protein
LPQVNTTTAAAVRVLANNTYEWHRTNDNVNTITTPQLFIYGNNNGVNPDDIPIAGDWNGNGTDTIGYVRTRISDGKFEWHLTNTNLSADTLTPLPLYGNVNLGDVPVVGDWDGDGDVTIGVARPEGATWVWHLTNNNSTTIAGTPPQYGNTSTDQPVVGDWNGDGITDLGAIRHTPQSTQYEWHMANGAEQTIWIIPYGNSALGDEPIAGDWDGDGRWTPGVTRPVSGHFEWHLSDEWGLTLVVPDGVFNYGSLTTDKPIAANWDGI